ncbi:hypothetical protein [Mycolicibacterium sp. P9-64]|nr:hypothetical protein [Mycolicibacterium sp. P9-64]
MKTKIIKIPVLGDHLVNTTVTSITSVPPRNFKSAPAHPSWLTRAT